MPELATGQLPSPSLVRLALPFVDAPDNFLDSLIEDPLLISEVQATLLNSLPFPAVSTI